MFVFQAAGNDEKVGVIVNKHPNEFIKGAPPDKVEVITFNADSPQGKEIAAADKTLASAREEVVAMMKDMTPAEKTKAMAALEKFDKAAAAYNIEMMNYVSTRGAVAGTPEVGEKLASATHELRMIVGGDPAAGYDPVGKLADAANNRTSAVFTACASVTVMTAEYGKQAANEKLAEQKKTGSATTAYERLPTAGTSDAAGPSQPVNYRISGTLNSSDLESLQRNYKPIPQPVVQQKDTKAVVGQAR